MIEKIRISNFRKFANWEGEFAKGVNILQGPNGSGKTSIAEAIAILASRKSFRENSKAQIVRHGESAAILEAKIDGDDYAMRLDANGPSELAKNGKIAVTLKSINEALDCIVFSIDDLQIILGGPEERRSILDTYIYCIDPQFQKITSAYSKVAKMRAKILFAMNKREAFDSEEWDSASNELIKYGSQIMAARIEHLPRIQKLIAAAYANFFDGELKFEYRPSFMLKANSIEAIESQFRASIEFDKRREIFAAHNLYGPHRDEIAIMQGGDSFAHSASLGQMWALAASFRFAEFALKDAAKTVMIFDDVFSIIDDERSKILSKMFDAIEQIFVTTSKDLAFIKQANMIELK